EDPAATEDRGTLSLYAASTGTHHVVCEGQGGPVTSLAFRPDGLLASGGVQSSDVCLWDVPAGLPRLILTDAVDQCSVQALAFQARGELLAVAGIDYLATGPRDGCVAIWHRGE